MVEYYSHLKRSDGFGAQYQHAILGTTIKVPTLSGEVKLKISSGIKDGQILRLRGKGIKQLNGHKYGDQFVKISINITKKISKKTHNLLVELSKEIGEEITFEKFNE